MSAAVELWRSKLRSWKEPHGILRFVDENFHVKLDPWQEEALLLFESPLPEHRRISLQACAGPGKSAVLSWAGWWFLGTQGDEYDHPKGLVTSITDANLHDNLWAEFAKWQAVSAFLSSMFVWTSSKIFARHHHKTWFLGARSWPKTANADEQGRTFSGLHSPFVLVLVDESGAIPTTVLRAGEQALGGTRFGKILQAGNPISLEGMLFAAANELRDQWVIVKITGDPNNPKAWVHSPRVMKLHVDSPHCICPLCQARQQIKAYGRDNAWVKAYILGEFPPGSINSLVSLEEVEAAMELAIKPEKYAHMQKRLGVDVARFGDDRSVIFPRQGSKAFMPVQMRNATTTDIAARVGESIAQWNAELVLVDDTGHWGHGVIDQLNVMGVSTIGVVFHAKANHQRFKNKRAEMWVTMCDAIKKKGLALPKHCRSLVAELTTMTYTFNNGQVQIEDKELVKKRLGRSPDIADALALTYALADMPSELIRKGTKAQVVRHDWNPFESRD